MQPADLILAFARNLEFDDPVIDPKEGCVLEFEDGLDVRCQMLGRQEILLSSRVCGGGGDMDVKRLLQLNLGRATRQHEVLAADPASGDIVLYAKFRTDEMENAEFDETMERFLNTLDFWKTNSGQGAQAASSSPFSMMRP